jgi:hypothetical protein
LKTRFCKIRFAKPAPSKAFGGIEIKKIAHESAAGARNARIAEGRPNFISKENSHQSRATKFAQEATKDS